MGLFGLAPLAAVVAAVALMPSRTHLVAWARRAAGDPLAPTASTTADQGASIVPLTVALGVIGAALSFVSFNSLHALLDFDRAAGLSPLAAPYPVMHAVGAAVLLPVIFAAASENSALRHPRNVVGWTLLSLTIVLFVPLAVACLASFGEYREQGFVVASLSPLFLAFVGTYRESVPVESWISSVLMVVFFVTRARSARRALVMRLAAAAKT